MFKLQKYRIENGIEIVEGKIEKEGIKANVSIMKFLRNDVYTLYVYTDDDIFIVRSPLAVEIIYEFTEILKNLTKT